MGNPILRQKARRISNDFVLSKNFKELIQDLKDQGLFKNLDKMTDQELVTLNETIDNILTTGRAEQKQINQQQHPKPCLS